MPTRLYLYPYKMGSTSAKKLAEILDIKRVRQDGNFRWKPTRKVINWGNTRIANWMLPMAMEGLLNRPSQVELASDKIQTFSKLAGIVPLPDTTTIMDMARGWVVAGPKFHGLKHAVLCRTLTRANSGRGIVVAETPDQLVPAPLYTRYTPKQHEYRVHVFKELGVIDVQQKKRSAEGVADPYVRNHAAGWVFCRDNVTAPQGVLNAAVDAVMALDLDFGAVDIGFHNNLGPCVYEVNTAPGLEGQTLTNYAEAFKQIA